jgi:hypothetical protein
MGGSALSAETHPGVMDGQPLAPAAAFVFRHDFARPPDTASICRCADPRAELSQSALMLASRMILATLS